MTSKISKDMYAVACLILSATFWGMVWYPLRWLKDHGLPGLWTTTLMFAVALTLSLPALWHYRKALLERPRSWLALAVASGWCNTAFMLALLEGEVARVILLFYLSPLWAGLLARFWLREALPPAAWLVLTLAMSGALIILWHPSLHLPWPRDPADWLALSAGLGFAWTGVLVRKNADMAVTLKTAVTWLGVVALAGGLLALGMAPTPVWQLKVTLLAVVLGVCGIGMAGVAYVYGVGRLPVHRSAAIMLFEVLVGALSARLLAGQALTAQEWLGGVLILSATWVAARQQHEP